MMHEVTIDRDSQNSPGRKESRNNLSENDIREYVKRRKISGSTRSEAGRRARDTFTSLKKTCRKLAISFWDYIQDRLSNKNKIAPLPELILKHANAP